MSETKELQVTSLDVLRKMAKGEVVELPAFDDGTPFVARLRKPSLMSLVGNGKIPNALLSSVATLFDKKSKKESDNDSISESIKLFRIVAESALVEPALKDIEALGISLTDKQLVAIFNYTQTGVAKLESFRQEEGSVEPDNDSKKVSGAAVRNTRP